LNTITVLGDWQKYTILRLPQGDSASLVILAQTGGKIALDVISLFPKDVNSGPTGSGRSGWVLAAKPGLSVFWRMPWHGDGL
jgi:hypothetical protein